MNWYSIKRKILTFIGDIKWSGILHPFWFTINAKGYQLKGSCYREICPLIEPGDILLRRFEGYIDKWLVPGYWNHSGLYVGNEQVVHAISEGVVEEDILDFMRTDHLIILRHSNSDSIFLALDRVKSIVGSPYDFDFDFKKTNRFSCTELIYYCYPDITRPKNSLLGKKVIIPDDIRNSKKLKIIWYSK